MQPAATAALRKLGADLATARKRRRQPLRAWATRLDTSVPALMKMEKGDAAVSIDVYATALWFIGRREALAIMADPKENAAALENETRAAAQRHRRSPAKPMDLNCMAEKYIFQDRLFLWWLGEPAQPRPVGEPGLAAGGQAVSLCYAPDWLRSGFALSKDLPLTGELFASREKDSRLRGNDGQEAMRAYVI